MSKKMLVITIALCLAAFAAGFGFAAWHSVSTQPEFAAGGYVLRGNDFGVEQLSFAANEKYKVSGNAASFKSGGNTVTVPSQSFAHLDNGSVMAISDGVLLDFNDLSENFINNYFISARLPIYRSGSNYTAETTSGTIEFGEHMWKLSDTQYLIESPTLTVSFSENDKRGVNDYVQINITKDDIVQIITADNMWMTISENCYIETAGGVRIYPVNLLIENSDYKLSMAKLSVSPEDSIVLSPLETRRQIVPELNIESIDGQNGSDGSEGQTGQAGQTGENGLKGEDGAKSTENGKDGENGKNGDDGTAGSAGTAGTAGDSGQSGSDGKTGTAGTSGESGQSGSDGKTGVAGNLGVSGESGESGSDGNGGEKGKSGYQGKQGSDAVLVSSTNAALPTMSIVEWNVSSSDLSGTIAITDENSFLTNNGSRNSTVIITDVKTGEEIFCYQLDSAESDVNMKGEDDIGFTFAEKEVVYFSTQGAPLKPDTEYRLSVNAYYTMNDITYCREFLSRNFFTDSAGVFLSKVNAGVNSIDLRVSVANELKNAVATAQVFLLTPEQNANFSLSAANSSPSDGSYQYRYTLNYRDNGLIYFDGKDGSFSPDSTCNSAQDQILTYGPDTSSELPSDRTYIARVIVTNTSGSTMLTDQALTVRTLKTPPTWSNVLSNVPVPHYNRVTGGFEVRRPAVTDKDGGATNYTYTAYKVVGDTLEEVVSRTLSPGEAEPAVFYLAPGVEYVFGIDMKFNDNEKDVMYNLVDLSNVSALKNAGLVVSAQGSTLPKLVLDSHFKEYNNLVGTLTINLSDANTRLDIDSTKPLTLELYADSIKQGHTVVLTGTEPVSQKDSSDTSEPVYTYTLGSESGSTNYRTVDIDLSNLFKNTNYSITVKGFVDVNDGNGSVLRDLGSVSFRTLEPLPIRGKIVSNNNGDSTIAVNVQLSLNAENDAEKERSDYELEQLEKGQVKAELYNGTGFGMTLISYNVISDKGKLEKLYSAEGLDLTEQDFGNPTLNPSSSYTVKISDVTDQSYRLSTKDTYINDFDFLYEGERTFAVVASATLPDLLTDPAKAIKAVPIYNKDSAQFGKVPEANLPEDAIVGYALEARYDNAQRLAQSITYYAMEYKEFWNAAGRGADFMTQVTHLMETKLLVSNASDTVPKVAYLFGGDKTAEPQQINGYNVFYAGDPIYIPSDGNIEMQSGMDRGFRYMFAYTVEFAKTMGDGAEGVGIYPNEHKNYNTYKNEYGIGSMYGDGYMYSGAGNLQRGKTYVLNSGMCEAPMVTPKLYSYVHSMQRTPLTRYDTPSDGSLILHYTYKDDVDGVISPDHNYTMIEYAYNGNTVKADFIGDGNLTNDLSTGWYSLKVNFSAKRNAELENDNLITPIVKLKTYIPNYDSLMTLLRQQSDYYKSIDYNTYLCTLPVDWDWDSYYKIVTGANNASGTKYNYGIMYSVNTSFIKNNYLLLEFYNKSSDFDLLNDLSNRCLILECLVETVDDQNDSSLKHITKTIYVPLDKGADYTAKLSAGSLGEELVGRKIAVYVNAYYDNGMQGWSMLETETGVTAGDKFVGLQVVGSGEAVGFQDYITTNASKAVQTRNSPSGGLMKKPSVANITSKLEGIAGQETNSQHVTFAPQYLSGNWGSYSPYLRIMQNGVNTSGYMATPGTNTVMTKGVSALAFQPIMDATGAASNIAELTSITPNLTYNRVEASSSSLKLNDFNVEGLTPFTNKTIYVRLYPDNQSAARELDDTYIDEIEITLDSNFRYDAKAQTEAGTAAIFKDLQKQTRYTVVFYVKDNNGDKLTLLDTGTNDAAIYSHLTSSDVEITSESEQMSYVINDSYFAKQLSMKFNLSRYYNIDLKYDVYSDLADAQSQTNKLLSHEQLAEKGILLAPTQLMGSNNTVSISMAPSNNRNEFKPGGTYFLRITAYEKNSSNTAPVGYNVFVINIPPDQAVDTLIRVPDIGKDRIVYQATVTDTQFSIMGNPQAGTGFYAVRFTYKENGKNYLLHTKYDNYVYPTIMSAIRFELTPSVLTTGQQMQPGVEYTMHVFAAVDADNDGMSLPVNDQKATMSYTDFFGSAYLPQASEMLTINGTPYSYWKADAFNNFINSFWVDNGNTAGLALNEEKPSMIAVANNFRIAEKTQKAAADDGVVFNTDEAALTRSSATSVRLVLPESFGLTTADGNGQVFKMIRVSVTGSSNGAGGTTIAVNRSAEAKVSAGNELIKTAVGETYTFYYDIPVALAAGHYRVTMQFYMNEADTAPAYTLSRTFIG